MSKNNQKQFISKDKQVTIKIKRLSETDEFCGIYYYNNKRDEGKTNYTNDLDDAIGTALLTIKLYDSTH
jgi:hypothetical protein